MFSGSAGLRVSVLQASFLFPSLLADSNDVRLFFVASALMEHAFRYQAFNYFGVRALQEMQANKPIRHLF